MAETFLAFERSTRSPRPTLTTAVTYDVAEEIDQRNGWTEPGERHHLLNHSDATIAREIFTFCFGKQKLDPQGKGMRAAFRRFVAISWMLASEKMVGLDGKPLSLDKLGKQPQLRCTRCALCLLAKKFGQPWGFRVRVQRRVSTKPNYARAARTGWALRRKRAAAGEEHPHRTHKKKITKRIAKKLTACGHVARSLRRPTPAPPC